MNATSVYIGKNALQWIKVITTLQVNGLKHLAGLWVVVISLLITLQKTQSTLTQTHTPTNILHPASPCIE